MSMCPMLLDFMRAGWSWPVVASAVLSAVVAPSLAQPMPASQLARHAMEDAHEWAAFTGTPAGPAGGAPTPAASWVSLQQGGPWGAPHPSGLLAPQADALKLALGGRWDEVLTLLKAQGVQPDFQDEQGRTLLTVAAQHGELAAVRGLLAQGAHPDRPGAQGKTPLGMAAWRGHELVVRELLLVGADVQRADARGQAPLHLAAQMGRLRVMSMLIQAGARTEAMDLAGLTPLLAAAGMGQIQAMSRLNEAGVPLTQVDRQGLNAVHAAALAEQPQAVAWLTDHGVPVQGALTQALIDTMGRRVVVPR